MASQTTTIANLTPPSRTGRVALGITVALLVTVCGGFGALCAGLEVVGNLAMQPAVALLALCMAGLFGLPYLLVILWIDRNEREPWYLVVSALVWGGVLATALSGLFNTAFGAVASSVFADPAFAMQVTASVSAPLVEETTKGAALLMLYLFFRHEFDNVLDGVIYGALVGLGFAVYENFSYYVNQPDGVAGVLLLTWVRGVVSAAGGSHATFTALTGLGLGLFRVWRRGWLRWLFPPLGLAGAMFLHFSWNTFAGLFLGLAPGGGVGGLFVGLPVAVVVIQFPFLALVLLVAFLALRHENWIIRTYLEGEEVLRAGELDRLVPAWRRTAYDLLPLVTLKPGVWWRQRRRNRHLVRLAFEKWHMASELADNEVHRARPHAVRVRALRKSLGTGSGRQM